MGSKLFKDALSLAGFIIVWARPLPVASNAAINTRRILIYIYYDYDGGGPVSIHYCST